MTTLSPTTLTTSRTRATGTLAFDPASPGVPGKPWYAIVRCDTDWHRLYATYLERHGPREWMWVVDNDRLVNTNHVVLEPRLGIVKMGFVRSNWGPHITVIRGEVPRACREDWGRWEGTKVDFEFDPNLKTNGKHWWLDVTCPRLLDLRERFGLSREPRVQLHLTVGVVPGYE